MCFIFVVFVKGFYKVQAGRTEVRGGHADRVPARTAASSFDVSLGLARLWSWLAQQT